MMLRIGLTWLKLIYTGIKSLKPLSTIFQLYHGVQFYWCMKPEYLINAVRKAIPLALSRFSDSHHRQEKNPSTYCKYFTNSFSLLTFDKYEHIFSLIFYLIIVMMILMFATNRNTLFVFVFNECFTS